MQSTVGEEGQNRAILTGVLDVFLAEQLHRFALDLLETGQTIVVDLSDVDSIDVSSMQILLSFRSGMVSLGRKLVVCAASASAVGSFRMAGLASIFAVA
jgi:anti-anti-sigma factor